MDKINSDAKKTSADIVKKTRDTIAKSQEKTDNVTCPCPVVCPPLPKAKAEVGNETKDWLSTLDSESRKSITSAMASATKADKSHAAEAIANVEKAIDAAKPAK